MKKYAFIFMSAYLSLVINNFAFSSDNDPLDNGPGGGATSTPGIQLEELRALHSELEQIMQSVVNQARSQPAQQREEILRQGYAQLDTKLLRLSEMTVDTNNPEIINDVGVLWYKRGKIEEAEVLLRKAADPALLAYTARLTAIKGVIDEVAVLRQEGKIREAEARSCQVVGNAPFADPGYRAYTAHLAAINNLGVLWYERGKIMEAFEQFFQAMRQKFPAAMSNGAFLQERIGNKAEAAIWRGWADIMNYVMPTASRVLLLLDERANPQVIPQPAERKEEPGVSQVGHAAPSSSVSSSSKAANQEDDSEDNRFAKAFKKGLKGKGKTQAVTRGRMPTAAPAQAETPPSAQLSNISAANVLPDDEVD